MPTRSPTDGPAAPPRRTTAPRRRKAAPIQGRAPLKRRLVHGAFAFVAVVLLIDGLVGERGFLETMRARQTARAEEARLAELRRENEGLRDQIRRLKEDPATIEAEARRQLGLIRPGELLFILKDARSAPGVPNANATDVVPQAPVTPPATKTSVP